VTQWRVPLADVVVTDDDIAAVVETYRSGWLSMGPRTAVLEERFADFVEARHAVAACNGTAALHLACLAAGIGPGDEVVVPSLTFVATVNAIAYTGATPVFADVVSLTEPWLSASAAEAAVSPRTAAIMTVAYGGHPGETIQLRDVAQRHGVALLEDAAHAAGSRVDGSHLGTFGAIGAFSFFSNKNLAVGEGGMVVTDDDDLAARLKLFRSHGMTTLTWDRYRGHASGYDVVELGYNYRLDDPRAALALSRLSRLESENERRRILTARYRAAFENATGFAVALPPAEGAVSAEHLFTIALDEDIERDSFRDALAEQGIQTSVHYRPVHTFAIYRGSEAQLPVTSSYAARTVTLPLYAHMTDEEVDLVAGAALQAARPARLRSRGV
jgi:dTDP-4-amino-4,6-dideoxygalactose transaminase